MQVRNFFNEDSMCFFPLFSLSMYIYTSSHEFSSYSLFFGIFADITWTKGTCPIHEVGRKVNGVIEKFQILQSEGDVLCTSQLARADLIQESFQSSSGLSLIHI